MLACAGCGRPRPLAWRAAECDCGGLLEVRQAPRLHGRALRRLFDQRRGGDAAVQGSGVWRYRELLLPGRGQVVTHPEGNTPLYRRPALARWAGIADLALKHEGENPTGSFKDRGMTVAVTQAKRIQARAVACASTGNTSASLASYAAHAEMRAVVFVPAGQIA
ncbi:MAG TPA: pyridoxal-phosphate dependent enzyme, partial [Vicinamibacteria bacterium]|nr:pyridoxal-phosphate dependent enzyme [Vicinamibacteria bacterium]